MFNTYYQEELAFLRDMGREFAAAHPAVAHMLESAGADPDVERLLEGVAFLTGRLRQKLDDEIPELFQSMMSLLWPHYLRPVPSTGILQFQPMVDQLSGPITVQRGAEVESVPVDGTPCRFRTCYDVDLAPIELSKVTLDLPMATDARLRIVVKAAGKAPFEQMRLRKLRFFLADDIVRASTLYLWLLRYAKHVEIRNPRTEQSFKLPADSIKPGGFAREEAILPYPPHAFMGYRLLQEYFTCPLKFYFIDFTGLERLLHLELEDEFEIVVPFSRRPEDEMRVEKDSLRLFCTPIVNLFAHAADGIRVDHTRTQYRIRPSTSGSPPEHYEIYSVNKVVGLVQGEAVRREYPPLHAFQHVGGVGKDAIYYQTRLYDAVVGEGTDTYISFVSADQKFVVPPTETISIDITASNRNLASRLKVGDVKIATSSSPEFARFRNITPITRSLRPPLGRGLHWRLISHLSLNYLSLTRVEALRGILELYNYQAMYDRQAARENILRLEGLVAMEAKPVERLMGGAPVRGTSIMLEMNEENFAGEGDMYMFATVLNEFFALYATMNSLTELKLRGTKFGEIYEWTPRLGQQAVL
ncbi:MAG: type VI secretion system baseplate subunit TssF [Planctomycetota bacterium]|nr:MAG: type VI secretion system baseplate subunit TssF [Planctomycetota bacterium]